MSNIHGDAQVSRVMVTIHGAGDWDPGYSIPMLEKIKGLIPLSQAQQLDRLEVNFSDVLKAGRAQATSTAIRDSHTLFMNTLANENLQATMATLTPDQFIKNLLALAPQLLGRGVAALFPGADTALNLLSKIVAGKSLAQFIQDTLGGISPTIQDVCVYLYGDTTLQQAFQLTLQDQLHEAQKYDEVILVSHSLGTVIAFDVLNAWTEAKPHITTWFTMGCPLAKVLQIDTGRQAQLTNPAMVDRWYNVYNTHDLVANPLSPTFSKDAVYDIFVEVKDPPGKTDPASAHDYFTNDHALKLVADAINAFG